MSETATAASSPEAAPAVAPSPAAAPAPTTTRDERASGTARDERASGTTLLGDAPAEPTPADGDKPAESPYEPFALPEGIAAESPLLATFSAEASKLGIPQAQAQALVTAVGERMAADARAAGDAQMAVWKQTNQAWQAEIMADPNVGGARLAATKTNVAKLFDDYVGSLHTPERKALNEALLHTGAGNHPVIFRAFAKIAAAHTEGGFVAGSPARGAVDRAALLYPTMTAAQSPSR